MAHLRNRPNTPSLPLPQEAAPAPGAEQEAGRHPWGGEHSTRHLLTCDGAQWAWPNGQPFSVTAIYVYNSHNMNANIATLKNSLSRYLRTVQSGEEVVVLDRERPIARIVPFRQAPESDGTDPLDAMMQRGSITHRGNPDDTAGWLKTRTPAKVAAGSPALSEVLLEMRAEEPW